MWSHSVRRKKKAKASGVGGGREGFEMSAFLGCLVGVLIWSSGKHDHLDSRNFGVKRNKIHALNCAKRILVLEEANPKILHPSS